MINQSRLYLPGLNGLRALAAISVMLSHVFQNTFGNWGIPTIKLPLFDGGVTLFFVISGFLITYLLLHEKSKTQTINIKYFYVRRILRIWPIYYLIILISIIILYLKGQSGEIIQSNLWYYIFFTANIPFLSASGISLIVHYWSLGVEEQFYMFWPWLVKVSGKKILYIALGFMAFWIACKYGSWIVFSNKSLIYRFFAVTAFHNMMIGAVGAIFFYNKNFRFMHLLTNRYVQIISWSLLLLSGFYIEFLPAVFRNEFIAVISLILVIGQVEGTKSFYSLEYNFFDFIGKISYGIYLFHPLIIYLLSWIWRTNLSERLNLRFQYPIIYLLVSVITVLVAWISFKYYETPFLRLKERFAIVKSNNSIRKEERSI